VGGGGRTEVYEEGDIIEQIGWDTHGVFQEENKHRERERCDLKNNTHSNLRKGRDRRKKNSGKGKPMTKERDHREKVQAGQKKGRIFNMGSGHTETRSSNGKKRILSCIKALKPYGPDGGPSDQKRRKGRGCASQSLYEPDGDPAPGKEARIGNTPGGQPPKDSRPILNRERPSLKSGRVARLKKKGQDQEGREPKSKRRSPQCWEKGMNKQLSREDT